MRRVYTFLDALKKVRIKLRIRDQPSSGNREPGKKFSSEETSSDDAGQSNTLQQPVKDGNMQSWRPRSRERCCPPPPPASEMLRCCSEPQVIKTDAEDDRCSPKSPPPPPEEPVYRLPAPKQSEEDCCIEDYEEKERARRQLPLGDTVKNALAVAGLPHRRDHVEACCEEERPVQPCKQPSQDEWEKLAPTGQILRPALEPDTAHPLLCRPAEPKIKQGVDYREQTQCDVLRPSCEDFKKDFTVCDAEGNATLWQNIKRILLICGGQEEPIERGKREAPCGRIVVDVLEAQRFVREVFAAMEVPKNAASEMADALIAADYFGHRSMGVHLLPAIAADLLNCTVDARATPCVMEDNCALVLVNGNNAPGPVVANFCMDLAMKKAKCFGIGWVGARGSNYIGMASWYACQALSERMIGICMSNAAPTLVPAGGIDSVLGENPISCVASSPEEQFLVDMGMSSKSIEQLELDYCNGMRRIPSTTALDSSGRPTTFTAPALRAQRLRAFSPEYKGFGLAGMVDILCGVLTGASYATHLRRRGIFCTENEPANLGQTYMVIDPMQFCGYAFEERLVNFHRLLRSTMPCQVSCPPLVPGDKEMESMQRVDDQGGLDFSQCTLCVLEELAERFQITPLRSKCCPSNV